MKKIFLITILLLVICGCSNNKKVECTYKNEKNEDIKSYIRVTLYTKKDTVEKEELYAVYKFKNNKEAEKNYKTVEKTFEQEESIKLEQNNQNIIAKGIKNIKDMQYDKKAKVSYYEQLGYSCK